MNIFFFAADSDRSYECHYDIMERFHTEKYIFFTSLLRDPVFLIVSPRSNLYPP